MEKSKQVWNAALELFLRVGNEGLPGDGTVAIAIVLALPLQFPWHDCNRLGKMTTLSRYISPDFRVTFYPFVGLHPFMILDGNHRAVAGLWWHYEKEGKEIKHLPETAWVGISDSMKDYYYYKRVLQAEAAKETRQ